MHSYIQGRCPSPSAPIARAVFSAVTPYNWY